MLKVLVDKDSGIWHRYLDTEIIPVRIHQKTGTPYHILKIEKLEWLIDLRTFSVKSSSYNN